MGFKKIRSLRMPEAEQGFIRYTCLTYHRQPEQIKAKIDLLVEECGGEYSEALKSVLCTYKSIRRIALEHNMSERNLYYKRKLFYEKWY